MKKNGRIYTPLTGHLPTSAASAALAVRCCGSSRGHLTSLLQLLLTTPQLQFWRLRPPWLCDYGLSTASSSFDGEGGCCCGGVPSVGRPLLQVQYCGGYQGAVGTSQPWELLVGFSEVELTFWPTSVDVARIFLVTMIIQQAKTPGGDTVGPACTGREEGHEGG